MVEVSASGDRLRVSLSGRDVLWALRSEIDVPLSSVRDVRVVDDVSPWMSVRRSDLGLRMPGTFLPNVITAGSYWRPGGNWTFCCLHRGQRALVVELDGAERYRRLVLGVPDPEDARRAIESARRSPA